MARTDAVRCGLSSFVLTPAAEQRSSEPFLASTHAGSFLDASKTQSAELPSVLEPPCGTSITQIPDVRHDTTGLIMSPIQKNWKNLPQRIWRTAKRTLLAYRSRSEWQEVVVHSKAFTKLPFPFIVPLLCQPVKGALQCPTNLHIVLVHNYDKEPLMARSLRCAGIHDFVTMTPDGPGPWRHTEKLRALNDFLQSSRSAREYLLYADSDDAVLRNDPARAVNLLHECSCDLLFSGTSHPAGYRWMPEVARWANSHADQHAGGAEHQYLNAGVFVGKTDFLREVVAAAMEYVTTEDLTMPEYVRAQMEHSLSDQCPDFPKGVGCDQAILRYLHPWFYPRMKIDFRGQLASR